MAFWTDPNQDEENQSTGAAAAEPKGLGGEGGIISSSGGGAAGGIQGGAQQSQTAPTKSGAWTNLNRYLDANQGADARMGQSVRGTVDQAASQYQTQSQDFQQRAQDAAEKNTVRDSGVVNQVRALGQGQAAPVDKDAFARQYNAAYQGPHQASEVEGYDDTLKQSNKVQSLGKMAAGDSADRRQLLESTYGDGDNGGRYGYGEKVLDSFILGGGQQGNQALQDIASTYQGYGKNFENLSSLLNSGYQTAQAETEKTRANTQDAYNNSKAALNSRLQTAAQAAADRNAAESKKYQALVAGDASALTGEGYDAPTLQYLKSLGYDFARGADQGGGYRTGDLASEGDVSGYNQLLSLLGESGMDTSKGVGAHSSGAVKAQVDAARQAAQLQNTLQGRMAQQNLSRNDEIDRILNGFNSFNPEDAARSAASLGISAEQLQQARNVGVDPSRYLKSGGNISKIGDVMSGSERESYQNLLSALGLGARVDLSAAGVAPSYSFDGGGFKSAIEQRLADAARSPQLTTKATAASGGGSGPKGTTTEQDVQKVADIGRTAAQIVVPGAPQAVNYLKSSLPAGGADLKPKVKVKFR